MERSSILTSLTGKILKSGTNGESEKKLSKIFGTNVFGPQAMKEYLNKEAFEAVQKAIETGEKLDRDVAGHVAVGMKNWALDNGATHYAHWFQPLTGLTAQKQDAFFGPVKDNNVIETFSVTELVQREPDASSFPHGGLRDTFEARGYTAWDPSSPAFIMEFGNGKTLYIPSVFISYTTEALDHKTPLLRSLTLLDKAATAVCQYFDPSVQHVKATLGWEQEYFVIDENFYNARPDLLLAGRTVFGHSAARGQQLEDHYFGSIPDRVIAYMRDFEKEALKLGIPVSTRHNEVAPAQYECAPHFEEVNVAADHNNLLMDVMEKVAAKHGLRVLLHEKPFAGINGNGKHNNWSLATSSGKNLLSPGKTPLNNLQFLTFLINTIKAIDVYADLMRSSIASAGNDHRLGANEAPPAIISIFTGQELENVLDAFLKGTAAAEADSSLKISIPKVPELERDNTDRNRTSPFPFTGNKFEYRAVGGSANVSEPMMVLNTIVADQLINFKKDTDALIAGGKEKNAAIVEVLKKYLGESQNRIFNGNNYSSEWPVEAAKRGLNNITNTVEALDALLDSKLNKVFVQNNILNERELHARYEIKMENFIRKVDIEAQLVVELSYTHVLPAALAYLKQLGDSIVSLDAAGLKSETESLKALAKEVAGHTAAVTTLVKNLSAAIHKGHHADSTKEKGLAFQKVVRPLMDEVRGHVDELEVLVDDSLWKLPKYREILWLR